MIPPSTRDEPDVEVVPIVAEIVRVGTRTVETGCVRVRTVVDEEPVVVSATLTGNYVTVDRIPIGRVVDVAPPPREVDGVTIVSVIEERLRIVRELILVEEVHLRSVTTSDPIEQTVTRRIMRAVVEREDLTKETE